jgi:3-oxoacyl-[acyl-carrier protein] reductase
MAKIVLVTGAARGIGQAIARDFSRDHDVAITWLNTTPTAFSENVLTIRADLTEKAAPALVVSEVMERFGRIDVIVNNAGLIESSPIDNFNAQGLARMLHGSVANFTRMNYQTT